MPNNKPTIEVISCITGDKDWIRDDQAPSSVPFTMYSDQKYDSKIWTIKRAYDKFVDPRRNSRIHKILIHKYSEADVTIWIDANMRFVIPPEEIVEKYLEDYDMAMFQHGGRDCIYDEALACAQLKLDDPEIIIEQAKHYEDSEYGKHKGLCSGYFIIRRNNQKTRDMNEAWWADYCRYSCRDQISLMPAIDKVGININIIPERWVRHDTFSAMGDVVAINHHKNKTGNFDDPNRK